MMLIRDTALKTQLESEGTKFFQANGNQEKSRNCYTYFRQNRF